MEYSEEYWTLNAFSIDPFISAIRFWVPWSPDKSGSHGQSAEAHAGDYSMYITGVNTAYLLTGDPIQFPVKTGYHYQINGWIKGKGVTDESGYMTIEFYKLPENEACVALNASSLESSIKSYLQFSVDNNVPINVGEFGLMKWCFQDSSTITVDNVNAVKPFGAIETPAQGGIASGTDYIVWGWALTPQPNSISRDGSTIHVYVDGVKLGNPVYNIFRSDIASLFPGYDNSQGAVGYFYLDTTKYSNGVHTIQWTVTDSAGNGDGIGSRYFSIEN